MSLVYGLHPVEALLTEAPQRVRTLLLQQNRRDARTAHLQGLARSNRVRCQYVPRQRLDRMAGAGHQGVVALCHARALSTEADFEDAFEGWPTPRLFVALEGVTDARNLGACIRSASGAGAQAVLLPKRRTAPVNEAALKAAAGSAERIMLVEVSNLVRRLQWLKRQGVEVVGADPQAPGIWADVDFTGNMTLVFGSEGEGLRHSTRHACDQLAAIPMAGHGGSLNVAVATGVLLFEAVRQRLTAIAGPDRLSGLRPESGNISNRGDKGSSA